MTSNANTTTKWKQAAIVGVLALGALTGLVLKLTTKTSVSAHEPQTTFQSPVEAGAALAKAAGSGNQAAVSQVLGADSKSLLTTGDDDADQTAMNSFATKYEKMNRWVDMSDGSRVLYIGADNFAFPVPLAKNSKGRWYFDAVAGAEEIRARDIGRNELLTIDACSALVAAQAIYFSESGEASEFAQRIVSSPGRHDGLYWPAAEEETWSPLRSLGELPKSSLSSASTDHALVIDGYTFRILTAQGEDAPGGAGSYMADGKMSGGFAILAIPVSYGNTGIMTFMTSADGQIYERDFGPDTKTIAGSIQEFNPSDDWSVIE